MTSSNVEPPYFAVDEPIYFEDFNLDRVFLLGSYTPTRAELVVFASQFDPQPFHLDDEAGAASMLGALAGSGWHSCVMLQQLAQKSFLFRAKTIGWPEISSNNWRAPVFPDDELSATCVCTHLDDSNRDADSGIVSLSYKLFKATDQLVMTARHKQLIAKRDVGGA